MVSTAGNAPRKRVRLRDDVWPEAIEEMLPYTSLYVPYIQWLAQEAWNVLRKRADGVAEPIILPCIAPPVAELLLRHLEWYYDVEIETDMTSPSHTSNSVTLMRVAQLRDFCNFGKHHRPNGFDHLRVSMAGGDCRFIRAIRIAWLDWKGMSGHSKLSITCTVWRAKESSRSVENGEESGGMVAGWRRDGGGMEAGWRQDGGAMEEGWRRGGVSLSAETEQGRFRALFYFFSPFVFFFSNAGVGDSGDGGEGCGERADVRHKTDPRSASRTHLPPFPPLGEKWRGANHLPPPLLANPPPPPLPFTIADVFLVLKCVTTLKMRDDALVVVCDPDCRGAWA